MRLSKIPEGRAGHTGHYGESKYEHGDELSFSEIIYRLDRLIADNECAHENSHIAASSASRKFYI